VEQLAAGDGPAVVDPADHVGLGQRDVGEELLALQDPLRPLGDEGLRDADRLGGLR
jgi:hypothetical protein